MSLTDVLQKEGPNCMIFTGNKSPSQWKEDFDEDDTIAVCIDGYLTMQLSI